MPKLFKLISSVFNKSKPDSKFIKVFNINKLSKDFATSLIKRYINNSFEELYIYTENFKYVFGKTSKDFVQDSTLNSIYLKIIQDYADTYDECISSEYQVLAFHKLWILKSNLVNSWVSAYNRNVLNLLTSLTYLEGEEEEISVEFKHFKTVTIKLGETVTFPSTFEYSYKIHLRKQAVHILFSQVSAMANID